MFLTWMQLVTIKMNIISDGLQFYVYNTGMTQKAEKSPIFKVGNYPNVNWLFISGNCKTSQSFWEVFCYPEQKEGLVDKYGQKTISSSYSFAK